MMRKMSWVFVGILCLVLVLIQARTQETQWRKHMAAGAKAHREGYYFDAVNSFQAAVKEAEAFGQQDPRLATSLNNLAELYRLEGLFVDAEPLYKRSLAIREKALGPEHPQVATSLENYAMLLRKTNREVEAARMEAHAEAIRAVHSQKGLAI
jgi:tetratricopeptide (TPR) repeat protein